MKVYAFIGKTGTGKSYNAQRVARQYGIKYIIDDAILIKDTKVIAGKSAKTEASKIASVKAAIFLDETRRKEMVNVLNDEEPENLLILGTSDEMVEKIATHLEVGDIYKKIYIEDIATKTQIDEARRSRLEDGKHVVPVPTFEIKKQFSGYLMDSLKIFNIFTKIDGNEIPETLEKTIIRPTYSYLGGYTISDNVINGIVEYVTGKVDGVTRVLKASTQKISDGMKLDIDIEIKYGFNIPKVSSHINNTVVYAIDNATGINIFGININVKSIQK